MATKAWLQERGRDVIRWFRNGRRDFRVRNGRLHPLIHPHTKLRFASRLYQLTVGLLDLLGVPEIVEFFLRAVTHSSRLTDGEIGMITAVLGQHALRHDDIRLLHGGLLNLIFRVNGGYAFAYCHTICMPENGRHSRTNRPILMHELTHVYQYEQVGSRYLGEAIYVLIKTKRDCYRYGGKAGLQAVKAENGRFADFNREQQAMIVQDYFTLKERGEETAVYTPFIEQIRNGEL